GKLASSVPSASNVAYYASRVQDMFLQRQAIDVAFDLLQSAGQQQDVKGFVAMAEVAVSKLSDQSTPTSEFVDLKDVLIQVWEETEQRYNAKDIDRKSTRLNSSHVKNSYAVYCLKKK